MEAWREVPGHPEYEVSDRGCVRSMDRDIQCSNGHTRRYRGKKIAPSTGNGGYQMVALYKAQKASHYRIHRLVLMAFFVGPVLPGSEACHNNGIPDDNRLENLRWGSRTENIKDKKRHGTENSGERNAHAKLTEEQVLSICSLHQRGASTLELSREFGVSRKNIQAIVAGRSWKHLEQAKRKEAAA